MISVNEPLLDGNEKKYLLECIDTGWISSEGPFVEKFERAMASKVSRQYGVAVCNGSLALDAAIAVLEIGKGDEVILPTFTIISCAQSIVRAGATPVLVDADPVTWNMRAQDVEKKITSRTKAIMVVHIYGLPVEMDPIVQLAKKHNLKIIEDAAEMHGQTYNGKPCGSFGDLSVLSFYPNKHVTTGEGGMVLTDCPKLDAKLRSVRNLCFQPQQRFVHEELGWNMRMTNMQAALGLAQVERLDLFVKKKRQMGVLYTELLSEVEEFIQLPLSEAPYAKNIYWVYGIVIKDQKRFSALDVMKRLSEKKIGTRPFFFPMHAQPVFKKTYGLFKGESYPVSENIARQGFYVPSGLSLTPEQIQRVASELKSIFREN